MSAASVFTAADEALLLELLSIATVNPLEGAGASFVHEAQARYAAAAASIGFEVLHHAPADAAVLSRPEVPERVRAAARERADAFLAEQPSLVLRLGGPRAIARTIMFNVHIDTVAGDVPVGFDGRRFTGRGAIDVKGPAVALLAGLREALRQDGGLGDDITVLIQVVPGEEGGCMGVYGTRPLVDAGFVGALNVFCEPTGHAYLDHCSASMTARIAVAGRDTIDDHPGDGHNATVVLGHLVSAFARRLLPRVEALGARACIAGCHTGDMHNRVYGSGTLLINFAYDSPGAAQKIEDATREVFDAALDELSSELRSLPWLGLTAEDARRITRLEWAKRGLPVLRQRDAAGEALLQSIGLRRFEGVFTCDAIWMNDQPGYTVVYGPGDLSENHAHAAGEFALRDDLERYAAGVAALVRAFRNKVKGE